MKNQKIRSVSKIPFGLGRQKPKHFREMARIAWENRDNIRYAWQILSHGICDGCSLGPYGMRDDAVKGVHLCVTRLRLLRINTMPALDVKILENLDRVKTFSGEQLRNLGRLPFPMRRKKGDAGFVRVSWEEAFAIAATYLKNIDPAKFAIYTTSRGLTNEVYYVAGKFARLMGTNNIDNAARLCHAASTVALKQTLGIGASSVSYTDWLSSDLIILAGANLANNQPVAVKYLYRAKQNGARIVVINPYREPGLDNYWVPSIPKSALFGTKLTDDFFPIYVGGDVAFFNGVIKSLLEMNKLDEDFITSHTTNFEQLKKEIDSQTWETLERHSGTSRQEMNRFAEIYAGVKTAIFIWSMGLTQHRFGVDNVKALINVVLSRGMIGRPATGVVPIRGHSGVQGAAEVGSVPTDYFSGFPVHEESAKHISKLWKFEVPYTPGFSAPEMLHAAHSGSLDAFYIIGGNFLDTMPEPLFAKEALERVPLRIHQDIVLNSSMFVEPGKEVLLLPAQTRYEQRGGGTVTSTERRIRYSPEIPGPRIGEARSEWEIITGLAGHVLPPEKQEFIQFSDADEIRREIDRCIPLYAGTGNLQKEKDAIQYGGKRLLEGAICDQLPGGLARFSVVAPQNQILKDGEFYLTTRRGKQFNSIVHGVKDPLTGSKRNEIFISAEDAGSLQIKEGDRILLKSEQGSYEGICRIERVHRRTIQVHWPEGNVLLPLTLDPVSHEPDYNTIVTIEKL